MSLQSQYLMDSAVYNQLRALKYLSKCDYYSMPQYADYGFNLCSRTVASICPLSQAQGH